MTATIESPEHEVIEEVTVVTTTKTTRKKKLPKQNSITHIVLLLDASGSMRGCESEVVEGINGFVKDQRELNSGDDVRLTLAVFDTKYTVKYNELPIDEFPVLTEYMSGHGGGTSYNDAFVRAMTDLEGMMKAEGRRLAKKANDGGDRVVFVTWTDGEENSSRMYPNSRVWVTDEPIIKSPIPQFQRENLWSYSASANGHWEYQVPQFVKDTKNRLDKLGWNFMFMGADLDAVKVAQIAQDYGYAPMNTMNFQKAYGGCATASGSLSSSTLSYRSSGEVKTSNYFDQSGNTAAPDLGSNTTPTVTDDGK